MENRRSIRVRYAQKRWDQDANESFSPPACLFTRPPTHPPTDRSVDRPLSRPNNFWLNYKQSRAHEAYEHDRRED